MLYKLMVSHILFICLYKGLAGQMVFYPLLPYNTKWDVIYISKYATKQIDEHLIRVSYRGSEKVIQKKDTILWVRYAFDDHGRMKIEQYFLGRDIVNKSYVNIYSENKLSFSLELWNNNQDTIQRDFYEYNDSIKTIIMKSYSKRNILLGTTIFNYRDSDGIIENVIYLDQLDMILKTEDYSYSKYTFERITRDSRENIIGILREVNMTDCGVICRSLCDDTLCRNGIRYVSVVNNNRLYSKTQIHTNGNYLIETFLYDDKKHLIERKLVGSSQEEHYWYSYK